MVVFWRQYFFRFSAIFRSSECDLFNTDFSTAKFTAKSILMTPIFDLLILVTTATRQRYEKWKNYVLHFDNTVFGNYFTKVIIELIDKIIVSPHMRANLSS